jgi:hypothetical protein
MYKVHTKSVRVITSGRDLVKRFLLCLCRVFFGGGRFCNFKKETNVKGNYTVYLYTLRKNGNKNLNDNKYIYHPEKEIKQHQQDWKPLYCSYDCIPPLLPERSPWTWSSVSHSLLLVSVFLQKKKIYIYIYIYLFIYLFIYMYVHTYAYKYMYVYMYISVIYNIYYIMLDISLSNILLTSHYLKKIYLNKFTYDSFFDSKFSF